MRSPKERFLSDILRRWRQKATESEIESALNTFFISQHTHSKESYRKEIIEMIYQNIRARLLRLLQEGYMLERLDRFWKDDYVYDDVKFRIYSLIDTWQMQKDLTNGVNLRRLAGDRQNLHTHVVVEKTNQSVKILLEQYVPAGQKTMDEIMTCWMNRWPKIDYQNLFQDMKDWAYTATIYKYDDYLYRNMLRGAWAKIKTYPKDYRETLEYRLLCECLESLSMCAEGHIARLANVFVGFDDSFHAELSLNERVGNAMSSIASSELSVKEKLEEGKKILISLNLPVDQHAAWLEALE